MVREDLSMDDNDDDDHDDDDDEEEVDEVKVEEEEQEDFKMQSPYQTVNNTSQFNHLCFRPPFCTCKAILGQGQQ